MHSWYYEIRVCEWGGVEWEKILALWSIFIMLVWHVLMLFCAIFAFFFKPLLQPFNFDKKYKRTKIHVERSVVDNVVVSHYVPKLNERLVQYSSTIVPIFIVSALVDASFSYKDTWNYLYFMGKNSEAVQIDNSIVTDIILGEYLLLYHGQPTWLLIGGLQKPSFTDTATRLHRRVRCRILRHSCAHL